VALGNPYGHLLDDPKPSVTAGVISALHRDIDVDGGSAIYKDMIQTDASINPGNSGGPLVNADGEVVGINTFVFTSRGVSLGLGFALPINTALELAQELIRFGKVRGAWVGIAVRDLGDLPVYVLEYLGVRDQRGVVVWTLEDGSPSAKAGIRLGDIVRAVNDETIEDAQDARRAIFGARAGDTIRFRVDRDGEVLDIPVTLQPLPGERSSEREVP
jgi:serine protease Do